MLLARANPDGSKRSQRWLAEHTGLNHATVNLLISGTRECGRDHLRALCSAFTDPVERMAVLLATLQDELLASGEDASRVLIRPVDGVVLENLHLSPAMNVDLGLIARRLAKEQETGDRLFTPQVDWLAEMIVRLAAHEADAAERRLHVLPEVDTVGLVAEEPTAAPNPPAPRSSALSAPQRRAIQAEEEARISRLVARESAASPRAARATKPAAPR